MTEVLSLLDRISSAYDNVRWDEGWGWGCSKFSLTETKYKFFAGQTFRFSNDASYIIFTLTNSTTIIPYQKQENNNGNNYNAGYTTKRSAHIKY